MVADEFMRLFFFCLLFFCVFFRGIGGVWEFEIIAGEVVFGW